MFKNLVIFLLLIIFPTTTLYSHSFISAEKVQREVKLSDFTTDFTYDEMLRLFEAIESGALEECSEAEQVKIAHFIAFLAEQGALPDEESLSLYEDTAVLLGGADNLFAGFLCDVRCLSSKDFMQPPQCKSWWKKQCKQVKKYVKKHKKALIIGAAIVVATVVVVTAIVVASTATATTAAAGAAGAAASATKEKTTEQLAASEEAPSFQSLLDNQANTFKNNISAEGFFQTKVFSNEENGRLLGSLFAHDSLVSFQQEMATHPMLAQQVREMSLSLSPTENFNLFSNLAHVAIDQRFSTDYSPMFASEKIDFNALSYQVRGESALSYGLYEQAVHDLGRAIEINPTNPIPYLERGVAHFGMGDYESSLEDYRQFTAQKQALSISEFSLGFAKGVPKGIYDSGTGIFLFLSDFVHHPIDTGAQMWNALVILKDMARSQEWALLSETLVPEVYQLVTEWDTLPSDVRGELAGYAFGKYGADIFLPYGLTKAASTGIKGGQELCAVYKGLQTAEQTLLLESVSTIGSGAKVGEALQPIRLTLSLGEEVGLSPYEMGQLKQAGKLETIVATKSKYIFENPALQESYEFYKKAQDFLKSYSKKYHPEFEVRALIEQTGVKTFSRPKGIPENYLVRVTDKGAGMEYVHPTIKDTSVRVMPGKPHSSLPCQQKPYVIFKKNKNCFDKFGNVVKWDAPEAHIPLDEFVFIMD